MGKTAFIMSLLFACMCNHSSAQDGALQGYIFSPDSIPLKSAIIAIVTQKDSLFYSFARTDADGKFILKAPAVKGRYLLIASYPKFADIFFQLEVDSLFKGRDFGIIKLPPIAVLMEEVTIVAKKQLMNIKGDTLEYNISQLKLEPNARVEDILKQLPGMQITRGGQIFSMGKMIEQVLVDGEPFFGNDPTLVTKNIRADIVAKIQVYDDASRREKMTGIADQNKIKTLDIKLKENKKAGVFGGIELGYLNNVYNNVLMLNKFAGKEKIFGYGLLNNTGKIGLGYKTLTANGGSVGNEFSSETGKYTGEGVPKVYGGGLNYANIWSDKYKLSTSININGITTTGVKNSYRQLNSGETLMGYKDDIDFDRKTNNQGVQLKYEIEPKSSPYFGFDFQASASQYDNKSTKHSILASITNAEVITDIVQYKQGKGDRHSTGFTGNWIKHFSKKGSGLSVELSPNLSASKEETTMSLHNSNNQNDSNFTISKNEKGHNIVSEINYFEPLLGGVFSIWYTNDFSQNINKLQTLTGVILTYDSAYSGNLRHNYISNRFYSSYQWKKNKLSTVIGTKLSFDKRKLNDIKAKEIFTTHFVLWQPIANFKYEIHKNYSLELNYNRTVSPPSLGFVQPLISNESLPYIFVGNRYLQPKVSNSIFFRYHNFRIQKMRVYSLRFNTQFHKNSFGYRTTTNNEQVITSPFNISKTTFEYSLTAHYGVEANAKKDYFMIFFNGNKGLNYNYINNTENKINSDFLKISTSYNFFKRNGVAFNGKVGVTYEQMKYSNDNRYNFKGFGFEGDANMSVFLPNNFSIEQVLNVFYKPTYKILNSSLKQFLWDVSVKKQFGKKSQFAVVFTINDLLNQNRGFQRFNSSTGFTENRYTAVQRYFLLSFKWDYNKMGEK